MNTQTVRIKKGAKTIGRMARVGGLLLAICSVGVLSSCALSQNGDFFEKRERIAETEAFTGGQALAQRKARMRRAHRDLLHLEQTLVSLRRHRYTEDVRLLRRFVRPYLLEQVDPLLSSKTEGWHPELVKLDANLLFAKGAVLAQLGDARDLDRVIKNIESRFDGLDSLLVENRLDSQSTLGASLEALRKQRSAR
jgi:hypothetical protein